MIRPASRPRRLLAVCLTAMTLGTGAPTAHAAPQTTQDQPDTAQIDAWQQTILARPLFSPTRRPTDLPGAGDATPRLTGIVVGNGRRRAIFMIPGQARGRIADVGDSVGPWRIVAIENGAIRVQDPTGEHMMRPDRDRRTDTRPGGSAPPRPEEQ
ncbi:general secretion pathway protein GspN [Gluconacetobacter takamatsuzukensis]|uniref:General secretion pathway protein GspN n=1 Tax=Gluconacetobacter takamatsuzukensis TaxID=1286190 RepID=A0A7W4KE84_9PROT|nr:general secretion pathway protein GspN [Gluconacetobacter takamatsuzukensis]MBB2205321.1 general secretion pathway protein GspN [Gluconacetobacter takamatsuzukensis]